MNKPLRIFVLAFVGVAFAVFAVVAVQTAQADNLGTAVLAALCAAVLGAVFYVVAGDRDGK